MDHGELEDVGRSNHQGRAAVGLAQCSGYNLDNLRDWRWQLWPRIHKVYGLICCEDEDALLGAILCVPSP
jgi:hypothetical protein